MKFLRILILISFIVSACSKGEAPKPKPKLEVPAKAVLSLPAQNEVCTSGKVLSTTESVVTLKWQASANTSSYEVNLKNLLSGISVNLPTELSQLDVTLLRNTPYSWYVISKSSAVKETAQSDTWKFYNAGPGTITYAPYPSEIVAPTMGQIISSTKVTLEWKGSHVENDIVSYDIRFGTSITPGILKSNHTETFLADVPIAAGTTYYWKVIAKDSKGNTSDSGTYQFRAL